MRDREPFLPDDLGDLDAFLSRASLVVAMEDVFDEGLDADPTLVGMRHDCDNVIKPAVEMAIWEAERDYRSTYYILHTAPYWQDKDLLRSSLERIVELGHEVGIHNDAITVQLETGRAAVAVLADAVEELRGYGFTIRSTVAHGNARCHADRYVNDEMFTECHRDDYGDISRLGVETYPLASFGLEFDANWIPRGDYLSDSGGQWSQPFDEATSRWPRRGQLHMLVHPDWWGAAFTAERAAA